MGKAYECDRCGKLMFSPHVASNCNLKIIKYDNINQDLCYDCAESFWSWWKQEGVDDE